MKVMVEDRHGRPKTIHNVKHIQFGEGVLHLLFMDGKKTCFKTNKVEGIFDDNSIRCLTIDCKYQKDNKCVLQQVNKNEGLSINQHGICISYVNVDDEDD